MIPKIIEFVYKIHEKLFGFKNEKFATKNGRKYYLGNMILISLFLYLFSSLFYLKQQKVEIVVVLLGAITTTYGIYANYNVKAKGIIAGKRIENEKNAVDDGDGSNNDGDSTN